MQDGFKTVNAWVGNGISWLEDIGQFYRERSVIEKEYSAKLAALAKKYYEKKAKKSSSLSVGESPTMTPGSLERFELAVNVESIEKANVISASLTTWTTQLTTLESRAAEHDRFGTELITNVAEPLKATALCFEELRKRHADFAEKLEKERDSTYSDLRKMKGKYDATCQEVENKRKKAESSFDYSKAKAHNAYQQQVLEMNNVKNSYLIAINVTNRQKEKYYHEYIPDLIDSLQDLSESRTVKLNGLWSTAAQLETDMLKRSTDFLSHLSQEIPRNVPALDSMMFVRHNVGSWQEPPNKVFEPSPIWHDDDAMVVDDNAKVFLRNVLAKSKAQLGDLRREVDKKQREVEGIQRTKQAIREGKDKRNEVEVVGSLFAAQEELHQLDHKRLTAEVETETITAAVGDVTLGARSHNFKSQTFKIPTNCDLCGERIWGLSAKGFDCRDCGYTCHSKCEMKVPAECPGEQSKEEKKKLKAERQEAANALKAPSSGPSDSVSELPAISRTNTMNSLSSGYAASANRSVSGAKSPTEDSAPERPTSAKPSITGSNTLRKNRIVAPPPTAYVSELAGSSVDGASSGSNEQKGRMLYPYDANGEGEITVAAGKDVTILEPDGKSMTSVHLNRAKYPQTEDGQRFEPASRKALCPQPTSRSWRRFPAPRRRTPIRAPRLLAAST